MTQGHSCTAPVFNGNQCPFAVYPNNAWYCSSFSFARKSNSPADPSGEAGLLHRARRKGTEIVMYRSWFLICFRPVACIARYRP